MNLTKEQIRRTAIKSGRYDLLKEKDRLRLDNWVNSYYTWFRAGFWKRIGKEALVRGPIAILAPTKTPEGKTPERFHHQVLVKLREWGYPYFYGDGALHAAMSFAKQICFETRATPIHYTIADLFHWEEEDKKKKPDIGSSYGDVLLLEIMEGGAGELWYEQSMKIMALLRSHQGPTIVFKTSPGKHPGGGKLAALIFDYYNGLTFNFKIGLHRGQ